MQSAAMADKRISLLLWLLPLIAYSSDAQAWGLTTHVYFSQLLLWAVPLLDPRLKIAARKLPGLVLAGACLPDLMLTGRFAGTSVFSSSHHWETASHLIRNAVTDEEAAIALGYGSHLIVDIIAHNHFVPAHETIWINLPVATHAASEWAMDAHVERQVFQMPSSLLKEHHGLLANYLTHHFTCGNKEAGKALVYLANATRLLEISSLPRMCYRTGRVLDRKLENRFDTYLAETGNRLQQITRLLAGEQPAWHADVPCARSSRQNIQRYSMTQLNHVVPLPADLFEAGELLSEHQ
jgi:hypothetical protein